MECLTGKKMCQALDAYLLTDPILYKEIKDCLGSVDMMQADAGPEESAEEDPMDDSSNNKPLDDNHVPRSTVIQATVAHNLT